MLPALSARDASNEAGANECKNSALPRGYGVSKAGHIGVAGIKGAGAPHVL